MEVDVDAVSDGENVIIAGVMEHIEEAGIHSGDSACSIPPYTLGPDIVEELKRQTRILAKSLGVVGLSNVQFAIHKRQIFILEVNPRASRTVPYVSKVVGVPFAKVAARVMAGETLHALGLEHDVEPRHFGVKEAVFPFKKFPGVDVILGPEMKSTGEVMGLGVDFPTAFLKAQEGAGSVLPLEGRAFISVRDEDKAAIIPLAQLLVELGFSLVATAGTRATLMANGIEADFVYKVIDGEPGHIVGADGGGRGAVRAQHHGGQAIDKGQLFHTKNGAFAEHILFHDAGRRAGGHPRHTDSARGRTTRCAPYRITTRTCARSRARSVFIFGFRV